MTKAGWITWSISSIMKNFKSSSSPAGRLFVPLSLILLVTLFVVSFLVFRNKPTLVELNVTVQRAVFEALPSRIDSTTPLGEKIYLLSPSLEVEALEVEDVDCVETNLEGIGRTALLTEPGGSIIIEPAVPVHPSVIINEPTSMEVMITGRDKVTLLLKQNRRLQAENIDRRRVAVASRSTQSCGESIDAKQGWSGFLPPRLDMSLRLKSVQAYGFAGGARVNLSSAESYRTSGDNSRLRIIGGRRDSELKLALTPAPGPATLLRVLDPETGELSPPKSLPITMAEPRYYAWKDRLVLLDPGSSGERVVTLLQPDLKVRGLELDRKLLEEESFVVKGKVRFPAGEKGIVELEPGFYVSLDIDPERPLTLRSLEFSREGLRLLLWGEPTSLRIGPTPELHEEHLPSYLEWLSTHRLGGLIYGTLAYVSALSLAVFKLLGWSNNSL